MAHTDLPSGPSSVSSLPLPPETDSSGEAVSFHNPRSQSQAVKYHHGVIPELSIGSPKTPETAATSSQGAHPAPTNPADLSSYQSVPLAPTPPAPVRWETVIEPAPTSPPPTVVSPPSGSQPVSIIDKLNGKPAPTLAGGTVLEETEVMPTLVWVLATLSCAIGAFYLITALATTFLGYLLNVATGGIYPAAFPGIFFQSYPAYLLLPLVLWGSGAGFWFMGNSLFHGSRRSWWGGLIMVLATPLLVWLTAKSTLSPVQQFLSNPQLVMNTPGLDRLDYRWLEAVFTGQLVFVGLVAGWILAIKAFHFPTRPFTKKQIWVGGFLALMTGLPIMAYGGMIGLKNIDTDRGFADATQAAGFHVYRPIKIPAGWQQITGFFINPSPSALLVGRDDFVQVMFDTELRTRVNGSPSQLITVRQIDVPSTFDVNAFAGTILEGADVRPVAIQRAQGLQGYLVTKSEGDTVVKALALVTSDNVLILLSSKGSAETPLVNLANALD